MYQINVSAVESDEEPPLLSIDNSYGATWAAESPTLYYFNVEALALFSIDVSNPQAESELLLPLDNFLRVIPSPDNDVLLIESSGMLLSYTLSTGELSEFTSINVAHGIRWTADGESFVYINNDLYVVNRNGTESINLTNGAFRGTDSILQPEPTLFIGGLAPEETHVLINAMNFVDSAIYAVPLGDSAMPSDIMQLFQVEGGNIEFVAWSPCLDDDSA